jgi:endonuclease/exonuclease/phosphatase family metal-dependent hydrolase
LYAIHTLPPLSRSYSIDGRHEFGQLLDRLDEEEEPHVVVGDFNSTRTSAQYRAFTKRDYSDAWALREGGRGATWLPASLPLVIPGLTLDHFYLSHGIEIGRVSRGARNGSDHRPLTVDIDTTHA